MAIITVALLGESASAQLAVRPTDPLGLSVRERRVQVLHATEPGTPGTSADLIRTDPWLAYQRGRSLFEREWTTADGLFTTLPDRPTAAAATSCALCHNQPFRSPGSGGNTGEPLGPGRNAPHLFGIGLIEMLAAQIRDDLLRAHDTNGNGFFDHPSETRGARALIEAAPGVRVDFGSLDDEDGDGMPDLNEVMKPVYIDAGGRPRDRGASLLDADIAGYDIGVAPFSISASDHQSETIRQFIIGVFYTVFGLPVRDETTAQAPEGGATEGWSDWSVPGARQPFLPTTAPAHATTFAELGTGELDLFEWYLLNHPAPARPPDTPQTTRGRALMDAFGCTTCHVADWQLRAASATHGGDRRFFDLAVTPDASGRLAGRLTPLTSTRRLADGRASHEPLRGAFTVRDLFTDFRYHDVGERFFEYSLDDGELYYTDQFRTPPLWGVGSTAPYGHDGASPTLAAVITRHAGEAQSAADAFAGATTAEQDDLIAFLASLRLYQPDTLPADLDGDGDIATAWTVAGHDAGPERFQPELLFRVPPVYRGWTQGREDESFFSYELRNQSATYGEDLRALRDADRNGIPDLVETRTVGPDSAAAEPRAVLRGRAPR